MGFDPNTDADRDGLIADLTDDELPLSAFEGIPTDAMDALWERYAAGEFFDLLYICRGDEPVYWLNDEKLRPELVQMFVGCRIDPPWQLFPPRPSARDAE